MTTNELIKLLQAADPDGNLHVRMNGGVPVYAHSLPGYYDGPYAYIQKDGDDEKYVVSKEGSKVDIICWDMNDFIERYIDIHQPNNWEYVLSKFKFCEEGMVTNLKKCYDDIYQMDLNSFNVNLTRLKEKARLGWKWYQNLEVDNPLARFNNHMYYTWIIFNEDGGKEGSCLANNESVLKSGLWEKRVSLEMVGYYEWVYMGE